MELSDEQIQLIKQRLLEMESYQLMSADLIYNMATLKSYYDALVKEVLFNLDDQKKIFFFAFCTGFAKAIYDVKHGNINITELTIERDSNGTANNQGTNES